MNKSSKLGLLALLFVLAVFGVFVVVKAAPPTSPYNPGETLNPTCSPTDANCTVNVFSGGVWNSSSTVGIGTTTPNAQLTVNGTSTNDLFSVYISSTQPAMYITAAGNVGIGTSTPSYKLDVAGTGRFTGALTLDTPLTNSNIASSTYWGGKQDALGFTPLNPANNLSDLNSTTTAKSNLGMANVENTALSTWAGSANITTLGTLIAPLVVGGTATSTISGTATSTIGSSLIVNGNVGIGTTAPAYTLM